MLTRSGKRPLPNVLNHEKAPGAVIPPVGRSLLPRHRLLWSGGGCFGDTGGSRPTGPNSSRSKAGRADLSEQPSQNAQTKREPSSCGEKCRQE